MIHAGIHGRVFSVSVLAGGNERLGGMAFSTMHANFLINEGNIQLDTCGFDDSVAGRMQLP